MATDHLERPEPAGAAGRGPLRPAGPHRAELRPGPADGRGLPHAQRPDDLRPGGDDRHRRTPRPAAQELYDSCRASPARGGQAGRDPSVAACLTRPSGRERLGVEQRLDDGLPPGALLVAWCGRTPRRTRTPTPSSPARGARSGGGARCLDGSGGSDGFASSASSRRVAEWLSAHHPRVASGAPRVCHRRASRCVPPVTQTTWRAALAGWSGHCSQGLSDADRRVVLASAHRRRFARGEVVFHEADPGDTVHLVAEGRLAARRSTPAGDTVTFAILGPGDTFGEMALLGVAATPHLHGGGPRTRRDAEPGVQRGRASPRRTTPRSSGSSSRCSPSA